MKRIEREHLVGRARELRDDLRIRARDAWEDRHTRRRLLIYTTAFVVVSGAGAFWLGSRLTRPDEPARRMTGAMRSAADRARRLQARLRRDPRFGGVVAVAATGRDGEHRILLGGTVRTADDLAALRARIESDPPADPLEWGVAVLVREDDPASARGDGEEKDDGAGNG